VDVQDIADGPSKDDEQQVASEKPTDGVANEYHEGEHDFVPPLMVFDVDQQDKDDGRDHDPEPSARFRIGHFDQVKFSQW
jgi:hypothetical protein